MARMFEVLPSTISEWKRRGLPTGAKLAMQLMIAHPNKIDSIDAQLNLERIKIMQQQLAHFEAYLLAQ
ncbi:hypothetical protein [Sulfuricurvum sp.]|uniref:hypothetical protein n=1 Tax=Sulfuricurvum sp. TaxID=2025608 RepID=UPI00262B27F8|nr:hypothetical protein [Sulfuricurvum sp.]MDD2267436.1 hypothetical protein [Sulfuricurvum sp.]